MTKQTGFIQNFIIPGIILVGVVIAGIAMLASSTSGDDVTPQKAALTAEELIATSQVMEAALTRATGSGSSWADLAVGPLNMGYGANLLLSSGYLTTVPEYPVLLNDVPGPHHYKLNAERPEDSPTDFQDLIKVQDTDGNQIGTSAPDVVLTIDIGSVAPGAPFAETTRQVCNQLNRKVGGAEDLTDNWQATYDATSRTFITKKPGITEGCVASAQYDLATYFKVLSPN